jgi:hypothetical protein
MYQVRERRETHAEFLAGYQEGEGHFVLTVSMRLVMKSLEIRCETMWTELKDNGRPVTVRCKHDSGRPTSTEELKFLDRLK